MSKKKKNRARTVSASGSLDEALKRAVELENRLIECLLNLETEAKPGLLLVENETGLRQISELLEKSEVREARSWWTLLNQLERREDTFVVLSRELSEEVYDILRQLQNSQNFIRVIDTQTNNVETASVDSSSTRLLFIASRSEIPDIERIFPIREKVGIIEVL